MAEVKTVPAARLVIDAVTLCGVGALVAAFALSPALDASAVTAALLFGAAAIAALAGYDARTHRLPNRATLGQVATGLGVAAGLYWAGQITSVLPAVVGLAVFGLIGFAEALHPDGLGGGDAKLLAGVGAWTGLLGWSALLPTLLCTHLAMVAILAAARVGGRGRRVVMGPAIAAGVLAGWLLVGVLL